MPALTAYGDSRLSLWLRVREFAVPPSMVESATARRLAGDWAGACVAAHIDIDFSLRTLARVYGHEFAGRIRSDLRQLAPDLLRWHMPRIAPDGLLRPGLTVSLASDRARRGWHAAPRRPHPAGLGRRWPADQPGHLGRVRVCDQAGPASVSPSQPALPP